MKLRTVTKAVFPLRDHLYILQLEEYKSVRFLRWFINHPSRRNLEKRKRLVWTNKALFLFWTSLLLMCATCYPLLDASLLTFFTLPLLPSLSPLFLITSLALLKPYEVIYKALAIKRSQQRLATHPKLIVIGVTGSFGKTSVKEILKQILSRKYNVLATPQSYNTTFGIARTILGKLRDDHEVFIVELGAYRRGEIKALCQMVKPKMGILTGVNEQHLERFGSLEKTIAAKTELLEALPPNGTAIINNDSYFTNEIIGKLKTKFTTYAIEREADIRATNIRTTETSSRFRLVLTKGRGREITTPLLGKHNISNILAAIAVALELGINLEAISKAVARLSPPPHRLELTDPGSGILIVDDSYSSNPDGFRAALKVIEVFNKRRKIIVTPGIIELGTEGRRIHKELGNRIAKICDLVILVGEGSQVEALKEGLKEAGFSKERITLASDLEKAKENLKTVVQPGDLVLFENDLPDQYA